MSSKIVKILCGVLTGYYRGNRGTEFDAVRKILHTGVIKPVPDVGGPRAEG